VKRLAFGAVVLLAALVAVVAPAARSGGAEPTAQEPMTDASTKGMATATFAGGCFWCMEPPFDKLDGVHATISGYTGGETVDPTYKEVSAGRTGHTEAVQIHYDPSKISYAELLEVFWRNIDPEAENRQFCDRGTQYRSGIFFHDEDQERAAVASKEALESTGKLTRIATEITPFAAFYEAEDYHQDYYEKNPIRYKLYRTGCGRDRRLEELWGE
jgi:peptide-methionine (S)-S-oxide reductase